MNVQRAIVWFRQDLRLHDNEALTEALKNADEILPVYVFDERVFMGRTCWFDFPKTGVYRAKFIIQAIEDLRSNLRQLGNELIVRVGKPEEVIFQLAKETGANWVFCNRERTTEELVVQDTLERKLWTIGREVRYTRGKMLYYTADLPFPITHAPDTFSNFRKEVERFVQVRTPLEVPDRIPNVKTTIIAGAIPKLSDFGHNEIYPDSRSALSAIGGETHALKRLKYYLWETDLIRNYKTTKQTLIGVDYSSKFSPYLAQGCLSPKLIYTELKRYEAEYGVSKSTQALFLELLWRDYFRLMAKKYEEKIFLRCGTCGDEKIKETQNNWDLFNAWLEGQTGIPFIDANMRELNMTGYMSNTGRHNVARFLVKNIEVNWQMGAEYFESILIDYDVSSNWGNWNLIAGIGSDQREALGINILRQAKRFDAKGEYVKRWIPELSDFPTEWIHTPDQFEFADQQQEHVKIGVDYPKAIIAID